MSKEGAEQEKTLILKNKKITQKNLYKKKMS